MAKVLHLRYQRNEETQEFVDVLARYREYISGLSGVVSVGQFDATGMYFSELKESKHYRSVNENIVKGGRYAKHTDITQLLRVDESLLSLVKGGISEYTEMQTGKLPIYASEVFREVLPVGMLLTDEQTGEVYEVAGYFAKGSKWVDENDLIRFPLDSLDGRCIAPWSEKSKSDIMIQLSGLHNTYVMPEEDADIEWLKQQIHDYSVQHGFEALASTLAEEYEEWVTKLAELLVGKDLFRDVLLTAHIQFTLPICLAIGVLLVIMATVIPAIKIFQYQPCELTGGDTNGNY